MYGVYGGLFWLARANSGPKWLSAPWPGAIGPAKVPRDDFRMEILAGISISSYLVPLLWVRRMGVACREQFRKETYLLHVTAVVGNASDVTQGKSVGRPTIFVASRMAPYPASAKKWAPSS